mmetsp:Transcript_1094/g.3662  ORF Transcript_1094/g.3662 Transcript_1094/m.3662 type:complete len:207 (+) Transcript_1094:268-888(+)
MSSQKRLLDILIVFVPAGWHPAHLATKTTLPRWYHISSCTSPEGVSRRLVRSSAEISGAFLGSMPFLFRPPSGVVTVSSPKTAPSSATICTESSTGGGPSARAGAVGAAVAATKRQRAAAAVAQADRLKKSASWPLPCPASGQPGGGNRSVPRRSPRSEAPLGDVHLPATKASAAPARARRAAMAGPAARRRGAACRCHSEAGWTG